MENSSPQTRAATTLPDDLVAAIRGDWHAQDYGRAQERMEAYWQAAPEEPLRLLTHAQILGHCGRYEEALAHLRHLADRAAPEKRLWALGSAGVACCDFQRFDLATGFLERAVSGFDAPAAVYYRLAEARERMNRLADAETTLAEGRARFTDHPGLTLVAARLARRQGDLERCEALARRVIRQADASDDARIQAGYELGNALDGQDRCAKAYAAFMAAKALQRPQADSFAGQWRAHMQGLTDPANLPTAGEFNQWAAESRMEGAPASAPHAFLVGSPRSGTTLLERMLDRHSGVASSSESSVWLCDVWKPFIRDERLPAGGLPRRLAAVTSADRREACARYWRHIDQTVQGGLANRLLLDKNPSVFSQLPAVSRFFPEARVLVARRDPCAIAWSCFTQYLPMNAATAAFISLDSTLAQIKAEQGQWERLRPGLATPWLEVRYEELVRQTESEMRRVFDFLDLPWEPDVLKADANQSPARSPSYAAATRPVYSSSLERWRRYESYFPPLSADAPP